MLDLEFEELVAGREVGVDRLDLGLFGLGSIGIGLSLGRLDLDLGRLGPGCFGLDLGGFQFSLEEAILKGDEGFVRLVLSVKIVPLDHDFLYLNTRKY